jgi:hypothetical protein
MMRDLDSLENYAKLWDDVWMIERDDSGETTPTEGLATKSD